METKKIETQGRGQLTERIKERSIKLLGYEICQKELRLIPYLQYQLVNDQRLNPANLNKEEQEILSKWVNKGYITEGVTGRLGRPMLSDGAKLKITKEFWNIILEILWLGYVDLN